MASWNREILHSWKSLRRAPGFLLAVVSTLALGIGGSTAIFTFVNGVLLRPLPYPEADRLVQICETHPERPADWCGAAPGNVWDWKEHGASFAEVGLGRTWPLSLRTEEGRFESIAGGIATSGLFETFGAEPARGRLLERDDHRPGADRIAILSHSFWDARFGRDETILGRSLQIDQDRYRVIGVLPEGFEVPLLEDVELWLPLWSERVDWRDWRGLRPYGRLAQDATVEEARVEMEALAGALEQRHPESHEGWSLRVEGLRDRIVASIRRPLWIFLGAVGLVLAIACLNAAILMLARSSTLEPELAMRQALGADRLGLLRWMWVQCLIVSSLAGVLGLALGWVTVRIFSGLAPAGFPRLEDVRLDAGVILFAGALTLLTTLVFGLVPAWRASRSDPASVLRRGGVRRSTRRWRAVMVGAEVALATTLLVGAGLLARSFLHLVDWQPGFETERLVAFDVYPPGGKYADREALTGLYRRIREELSSIPGVVSVGEVSAGPLFGGGDGAAEFRIEGRPATSASELPVVNWYDCGPGYFETMGISLVRGRYFQPEDRHGAPPVAIVNQTMAERHWPDGSPVGERVFVETHQTWFEIVGVVADTSPFDPRAPTPPQIYWPLEQFVRGATFYAVRTAGEPESVLAAIEARLDGVEPDLAVGRPRTLEERISRELVEPRFQLTLLGLFSGVALVIAMVGLYGVTAYGVSQRTREIGIRAALGAQAGQLFRSVLRGAIVTAAAGLVVGLLGGLVLTRALESLLVEVSPSDPSTFVAVAVLLLSVTLVAAAIPSRRATRIEPTECLREE